MLSSAFAAGSAVKSGLLAGPELAGNAFGCGVCPAGAAPPERAEASSDADDSGTGEAEEGAAWGAGSLTTGSGRARSTGSGRGGAPTDVSPVNGFLYSLCGVMTSRAVGL
jgi:hypothetical protein